MAVDNNLKLYIHIPFCIKKCNYCDFLSFPSDEETKRKYVMALIQQIELESKVAKEKGYFRPVTSIYMGGGTPSCLKGEDIQAIMQALYKNFNILPDSENTIEVNPGTTSLQKLVQIKNAGFNRLSIGMQSTCKEELEILGRIHSYEEFLECFNDARNAGFNNISVDIMTALPNQTKEILESTLKKVINLRPEHISAYSLIIEEGTIFYDRYGHRDGPVVGEELEREMYHMTVKILQDMGYEHYEISNFAKEGYRSNHNCGYWQKKDYLGLGLGASSSITDIAGVQKRSRNISSIEEYFNNPLEKEESEDITIDEQMDEYMFLGLRMMDGVSLEKFKELYNEDAKKLYGAAIEKLLKEGMIWEKDERIGLTKLGIDYGNYVFAQFLRSYDDNL